VQESFGVALIAAIYGIELIRKKNRSQENALAPFF
jgi:hypothetical protein